MLPTYGSVCTVRALKSECNDCVGGQCRVRRKCALVELKPSSIVTELQLFPSSVSRLGVLDSGKHMGKFVTYGELPILLRY